jgi:type III pantothenate kinase
MILAVDIGNSRVKCAVVDEERVIGRESVDAVRFGDVTTLGDLIRRVSSAVLSVDRAAVSSVVPKLTVEAIKVVERCIGARPRLVDHKSRMPFRLAVANPASVGTDRLCAAAGALGTRRQNAIVVDVGSAITVDVVREGVFKGGAIAVGPSLALRALGQYASQLPTVELPRAEAPFPKRFDDTRTALTLGALLGGVGAVREAVRYFEESVGATLPKFVTGGAADALIPHLPRSWNHDPDLTLKGLYVIDSMNRRESDA